MKGANPYYLYDRAEEQEEECNCPVCQLSRQINLMN